MKPASARARNLQLGALLREAGQTHDWLARAVNAIGAETGRGLRYDRSAVAHWLAGAQPRGDTPHLIGEALSRALGRPITPEDAGLRSASVDTPGWLIPSDPVAAVVDLLHTDATLDGHAQLRRSVYHLDAQAVPSWCAVLLPPQTETAPGRTWFRVGPEQISAAHHMTAVFAAADRQFGGGYARTTLAAYNADELTAWLWAPASAMMRRQLLAAAADLVALSGFKCFDRQENGLAQRHYLAALALAVSAEDPIRYAVVVGMLSQQAHHLGHQHHALSLAITALKSTGELAPPTTEAFLHTQAATVCAALGHHHDAFGHQRLARHHIDRASDQPWGASNPGDLAYYTARVRTFNRDPSGAIHALHTALAHYPATYRRSSLLTLGALANAHLDTGHISDALATIRRFLHDYRDLCSARVTAVLLGLISRLQPLRHHNVSNTLALALRLSNPGEPDAAHPAATVDARAEDIAAVRSSPGKP